MLIYNEMSVLNAIFLGVHKLLENRSMASVNHEKQEYGSV